MSLFNAFCHATQSWGLVAVLIGGISRQSMAETPHVLSQGEHVPDQRLAALRNLDGDFPFTRVASVEQWQERAARLRQQVLLASGLWPLPTKTPLRPTIHGSVERDDYVVEKVFFESLPGHFVTGSLYRPKHPRADGRKIPGILCPHGHWSGGRFNDEGEQQARIELSIGAERWENAARHPLQARCVQLARMGCVVFHYDMLGYADSIQVSIHPPCLPYTRERFPSDAQGFFGVDADARLQTLFGLQTWNSIRSLDFLLSLPEVDPQRIGVTGASGGGTQSMILSAIDERVAVAFPCVMVSTSMQGGCTCENAPYLRIGMGNIDIAALTAPRPLGLTAANDWTKQLRTQGYPDLLRIYEMLGHPERLTATFNTQFEHNYNHVSAVAVYGFMNRHFHLGFEEPVLERDFEPLSVAEMSVWDAQHPTPTGNQIGPAHERQIRRWMTNDMDAKLAQFFSAAHFDDQELRRIVGAAWDLMIGREPPAAANLEFELIDKQDRGQFAQMVGLVKNKPTGEALPTLSLYPKDWQGEVVLWVTASGKASLLNSEHNPIEPVQELLDAKCAVVAADLFGQGELTPTGKPLDENRMVRGGNEAWQAYCGFTYGYNPPLFIQRVRDLITLTSFIRNHERTPKRLTVVGLDGAGAWVTAARAKVGMAIDRASVDVSGFRFATIADQNHVDFVPGAVKYGDIASLLALSAPHRLRVLGLDAGNARILNAAYQATNNCELVTNAGKSTTESIESTIKWILEK